MGCEDAVPRAGSGFAISQGSAIDGLIMGAMFLMRSRGWVRDLGQRASMYVRSRRQSKTDPVRITH